MNVGKILETVKDYKGGNPKVTKVLEDAKKGRDSSLFKEIYSDLIRQEDRVIKKGDFVIKLHLPSFYGK
mgnify:CR=1 FL=1